jgi:hypothetical protein
MKGILKGNVFELEFSMLMSSIPGVKVFSNFKVHSKYLERSTDIDRLIVCPWGVYSIELKSFNHHFSGEWGDTNWVGFTGRKRTEIFNPVIQNYEHIRSLNWQVYRIGKKFIPIDNYILVPNSCEINSSVNLVMNIKDFIPRLMEDSVRRPSNKTFVSEFLSILGKVKK